MAAENRLAHEQSPYLLQHQNNPVDWFPWSDEAFARAAAEDKPIFLSIGYSTCHWCHVMERESFEDEEVARLMNDAFISIKVDREERPDIDSIYMSVCQMLTGHGGWPLTIVMTPDRRPFFAATYLPKQSRHGRPGMMDLIPRIGRVWREQREEVMQSAEHLTETVQRAVAFSGEAAAIGEQTLHDAYDGLKTRYDATHGGFGDAPKFPTPHNLLFLLRYWRRTGRQDALEMVQHTLRKMRRGGIFDHLGGGFHRYATDALWLLPHFEKMLYDQALLTAAYAEAFQATRDPVFETTARAVIDYVLRDLLAPEGGFYSAEDADSEGREGKFYVWTIEEVESVLPPEEAELIRTAYGLREEGNFEDEATRQHTGENVLHLRMELQELARETGKPPDEMRASLSNAHRQLFEHRERRVRPALDDKILTDWNGLMIAAVALAGRILDDADYIERARNAADFILEGLRDADGALLHRYRKGEAGIAGMADDYAGLIWGLIELYAASYDASYLSHAVALSRTMHERFWDATHGGYFMAPESSTDLIVRQKELYDGAIPSANSLQAWNLLRLSRMTGEAGFDEIVERIFSYAAPYVQQHPGGYSAMMMAAEFAASPSAELVIAGDPADERTQTLIGVAREEFRPSLVVLQRPQGDAGDVILRIAPYVQAQTDVDGKPAAYLCRNFACEQPVTTPEALRAALAESQS